MLHRPQIFFNLAALGLILGGAVHVIALWMGPGAIAYLGAPVAIVTSRAEGTWLAPVSTYAIAGLLFLLAFLSAQLAGWAKPYRLTRPVLWVWAVIFLLRGLLTFAFLFSVDYTQLYTWISLISSFTVLGIGVCLFLGLFLSLSRFEKKA